MKVRKLIRLVDNVEVRTATQDDLEVAAENGEIDCYPEVTYGGVTYYIGDECEDTAEEDKRIFKLQGATKSLNFQIDYRNKMADRLLEVIDELTSINIFSQTEKYTSLIENMQYCKNMIRKTNVSISKVQVDIANLQKKEDAK
jgi:hypothetical protein